MSLLIELVVLSSTLQLALPASPLLKIKRVMGVRKAHVHKVSMRLTWYQKAVITARMTNTLAIISMPQKSIREMFAFRLDWFDK